MSPLLRSMRIFTPGEADGCGFEVVMELGARWQSRDRGLLWTGETAGNGFKWASWSHPHLHHPLLSSPCIFPPKQRSKGLKRREYVLNQRHRVR